VKQVAQNQFRTAHVSAEQLSSLIRSTEVPRRVPTVQ
jgi:hypothetical protein